jgi:hypothetical protein
MVPEKCASTIQLFPREGWHIMRAEKAGGELRRYFRHKAQHGELCECPCCTAVEVLAYRETQRTRAVQWLEQALLPGTPGQLHLDPKVTRIATYNALNALKETVRLEVAVEK